MKKKPAKRLKLKTATAPDAWKWITKEAAAQLLECGTATIDNMGRDGRLSIDKKTKSVDLTSLVHFLKLKAVKNQAAGESADALKREADLENQQIRYRTTKAELAAMELEKQRGLLVGRDEVNAQTDNAFALTRTQLQEWTARLPEKLAGLDVREIAVELEKETTAVLNTLGDSLESAHSKERAAAG